MSEITPNTPNPVREDAYVEELAEKLGIDPQYIPKSPVWRNEEEIKAIAEMFANMSGGSSGGGVLVVHEVEGTLDKTWQEIWDAVGTVPAYVVISDSAEIDWDQIAAVLANNHRLSTASGVFYQAESANDYPVLSA